MRYVIDHDYHIHSWLSSCSADPEQSNERILRYAEENGLKQICLTNHFWDEKVEGAIDWYAAQGYEHISQALPLPQSEKVRFLFGCETELNLSMTLGISPQRYDCFDFIVIPTTHLQLKGFTISEKDSSAPESIAKCWIDRLESILDMSLPFHKVGIAHLTSCYLAPASREEWLEVLDLIPERTLVKLFCKAANRGVGIELNPFAINCTDKEAVTVLRPYQIAKQCGCRFYCGSDAHHPQALYSAKVTLERTIVWLELQEEDTWEVPV